MSPMATRNNEPLGGSPRRTAKPSSPTRGRASLPDEQLRCSPRLLKNSLLRTLYSGLNRCVPRSVEAFCAYGGGGAEFLGEEGDAVFFYHPAVVDEGLAVGVAELF